MEEADKDGSQQRNSFFGQFEETNTKSVHSFIQMTDADHCTFSENVFGPWELPENS